jgi:hypothetical protein
MSYVKQNPSYEALQYNGNNGQAVIDLMASVYPDLAGQFELQGNALYTWIYWTGNLDPVPVGEWVYVSAHPNANDSYGILSNAAFVARFSSV